jgi:hypothetical protein
MDKPDHPFAWETVVESSIATYRGGIAADHGVYDDPLACLHAGEPFVEHGIVEHRYKAKAPEVYFDKLLPRWGHVAMGPRRYSVSAFLASTLGQLQREGLLAWQRESATGFWKYNGQISYWAVPPSPAPTSMLTWEAFATQQGLDPSKWSLDRP